MNQPRLVRLGSEWVSMVALLLACASGPARAQAPTLVAQWAVSDNAGPLAVSPNGTVFEAHRAGAGVQLFGSSGSSMGSFVACACGASATPGPTGIAVDASGNIYYCDSRNSRVIKFDGVGNLLTTWGSPGAGPGQFGSLGGVAVDATGTVFVLDKSNSRVQKFTSDGAYLGQFGSMGNNAGRFLRPSGIALDAAGNVYVAEEGNARVQELTRDGESIRYFKSSLVYWGPTNNTPVGIAVDRFGFVYVAGGPRIVVFSPSGPVIGSWDFWDSDGIAVDADQNLYLAGWYDRTISKLGPAPTLVRATTWGALKSIYR